jgi:2-amino-4-hydroxy-6-hydroxymethyldihydropteridine diphosphokinase
MAISFLLLGTNIGDRKGHLQEALSLLRASGEETDDPDAASPVQIRRTSSIYESAAWGKIEQADYLNQAVEITTSLPPATLLAFTAAIETRMGRIRKKVWEPRIIDIDILFYGQEVIRQEKLVIPHPHLQDRRFVLTPLAQIAAGLTHPVLQKTIAELLDECRDPLWVRKYDF